MMILDSIKPGKPFLVVKPYCIQTYDGKYFTYKNGDLMIALECTAKHNGNYWSFLTSKGEIISLRDFNAVDYLQEAP